MMAAGILVFFTFVLSLKLDPASSQTTCNDFGFYCVSDTSFQQCIDSGPPVGPVNVCGMGTFCSMDCPLQCQENVPCTTTTTELPTTTTTVLPTTTTTELPTTTTTVLPTTTTTELPTTTTVLPTTTTTVLTTTTTTELPTTTTTVLTTTTTELPTTTTELPTTTTVLPTITTTELPTTTTTVLPPTTTTTTELPTTITTELPTTTTVLTTTTTELPTTTEAPFVCTASGRFADPTNCTNYYMCSPMTNGSFYQYLYPCPGGSVFNPATSKCTIDTTGTICPSSSSTTSTSSPATPSSSTTSPELPTTTEAPFVCTVSGRFADPTNCTNYYMCSPMTNGSFYQYLYPCPGGSVFNPATSKCTIDITGTICPSSSSSTSSSPATPSSTSTTSTTSTTASTPLSPPPSSSPTTSTSTSTSTSTTTTTTTTTVPPDFECTAPGRFADPLDCTKYYMCSSDGKGGFYKYLYTCPTGSAFNPATGKCSATAVCPLKLPLNNSANNNNNKNNKSNNNVKKLSFNDVE